MALQHLHDEISILSQSFGSMGKAPEAVTTGRWMAPMCWKLWEMLPSSTFLVAQSTETIRILLGMSNIVQPEMKKKVLTLTDPSNQRKQNAYITSSCMSIPLQRPPPAVKTAWDHLVWPQPQSPHRRALPPLAKFESCDDLGIVGLQAAPISLWRFLVFL